MTDPGAAPLQPVPAAGTRALYARFPRRLIALAFDGAVCAAVAAVSIAIAVIFEPGQTGRLTLLGSFLAFLLLYDPLMVSLRGATLGHQWANLHVVPDNRDGHLSFGRAVVRSLTKLFLGIFGFISMSVTPRHQAIQDLWSHSTIQMRDPSRATQAQYVAGKPVAPVGIMPSWSRRVLVTAAYLLLSYVLLVVSTVATLPAGCFASSACASTSTTAHVLAYAWWAAVMICIGLGTSGRLYGCRMRRRPVTKPIVPPAG